jgi:predicted SAM-dependent methyltransferase
MKNLEIGPTPNTKIGPDWDTMDVMVEYKPTYVHDLKKPMTMIPDNTYDLVYASHIMEHVPWYSVDSVFSEILRILRPGGSFEVWVPDFEKIVKVYLTKEFPDNWRMFNKDNDPMLWVLGRLFAYDRGGTNESNFHRNAFDFNHLSKTFIKNGFKEPTVLEKPRTVDHGWVNLGVSAKKGQVTL